MTLIKPDRLTPGDEIRIIAPSSSLYIISEENRHIATDILEGLGLKISFGKHVLECDQFHSSSIEARIEDIHEAFSDHNVKGILTVLGGYNSNQLLSQIDYDLILRNPKFFCGFSDITALQNAFLARSGLITYSGPHYSTFAMKKGLDYTLDSFKNMIFHGGSHQVKHSSMWSSDSEWYQDQENRSFEQNRGPVTINEGEAEGMIIGANLGTFLLLKGTPYMPSMKNSILFIEDTESASRDVEFDRNLQSLIDLPDFSGVKGIVIGRFEKTSNVDPQKIEAIIRNKPALNTIPVAYNFDFGHTTPIFTFPIGGRARLRANRGGEVLLEITS
jgi:muramoyltetrapeptide carboxypeptidase LdcA involved in peptidoglycan recycling